MIDMSRQFKISTGHQYFINLMKNIKPEQYEEKMPHATPVKINLEY